MKLAGEIVIIVASLGFEEKFLLRTIMRRGLREDDKIVVFMPEGGDARGETAFQNVEEIIQKITDGKVEISKHQVDIRNFYAAASSIRRLLKQLSFEGKLVINLSGGQRLLIFEILAAALSLGLRDAEIEIETEDSSIVVTTPIRVLYPIELDHLDQQILRMVAERGTIRLKDLEGLGVPKATLWRKLNKLTQQGLLEKSNDKYLISDMGRTRI